MTYQEAMGVLGLKPGFTEAEQKQAYRALSKKYHPDLNQTQAAEAIMRRVNEANEFLLNNKQTKTMFTHTSIFSVKRI